VGCWGGGRHSLPASEQTAGTEELRVPDPGDRLVRLLPDGAQIVAELDLARLRANPVVGDMVKNALAHLAVAGDDNTARLPGKRALATSPLADADEIVLASYGVGTQQADTLTLLATKHDVPGGHVVAPGVVAIGGDTWVAAVAQRAAIDARTPLAVSADLKRLRDHAMPPEAPGTVAWVTARLSFDARVALARTTGVAIAPAEVSVWVDVEDDLAMVIDADAVDPGDKAGSGAAHKLARVINAVLRVAAANDLVTALGVPTSLEDAHQTEQGTWVRTIVAVGPQHLKRAVARASAMLGPAPGTSAPTVPGLAIDVPAIGIGDGGAGSARSAGSAAGSP
jgi:hypothetical protein